MNRNDFLKCLDEILRCLEYREGRVYWKRPPESCQTGRRVGWLDSNGYRQIMINKKRIPEHRVVWFLHYRAWPLKSIDHINQQRHDNRIENLRIASPAENSRNRKLSKSSATGFKGVSVKRNWPGFRMRIKVGRKEIYIGGFKDAADAATAYNFAAAELYGEFASYNTVPQPWLESL